jgi:hypothetical protein
MNPNLLQPGLHFIEIAHDEDCPGRFTNGDGCTCDPWITPHSDVDRFVQGEMMNRAARRKAAREAEKALRKARRGGK